MTTPIPTLVADASTREGLDSRPAPPPFITVVVPVRNESRFVARTLEQLIGQSYPSGRFEILVIDGASTDATRSIAESIAADHPNVRVLDNPRRLSSSARNVGIRAARGDLIVVVDGHCELEGRGYFRDLAEAFERSGADCIGRPQPLDVAGATPLQRAIAAARSSRLGHHPDSFVYSSEERFVPAQSVAVAYRRSVFEELGLFDETFDACEDGEFNHRIDRAGLRCFFTPKVRIRYLPRPTPAALFRQMARYGRGRVRLARKHPATFSIGGFVPAAWLAGLVLGPLICTLRPSLWWLYGGVVALYLAIVAATSIGIAVNRGEPGLIGRLILVFPTIHAGSGWGVLMELLGGGRRTAGWRREQPR
ncbi:glycosyltransferase family 2 protein [Paludisphaera soli]|uniref:glycosyltransferase family 2 protein n=1 Tax=Paludisphaera soli TaxID=2712865 RepID=UPI0013EAD8BE|nr:glycosyltransferase family 2 protein [Paludisphaera soli]